MSVRVVSVVLPIWTAVWVGCIGAIHLVKGYSLLGVRLVLGSVSPGGGLLVGGALPETKNITKNESLVS